MFASCVLLVQLLCTVAEYCGYSNYYILAVYCGYSDYAFYLCTVRTVIMYSSCVMWAQLLYILGVYCG